MPETAIAVHDWQPDESGESCLRCYLPKANRLHRVEERRPVEEPRPVPVHADARDTERAAAAKIAPVAGTLRARVLDALREHGPATPDEVAERLDAYRYSVAPRITELARDGWIRDTGERRNTDRGNGAIVWGVSNG